MVIGRSSSGVGPVPQVSGARWPSGTVHANGRSIPCRIALTVRHRRVRRSSARSRAASHGVVEVGRQLVGFPTEVDADEHLRGEIEQQVFG